MLYTDLIRFGSVGPHLRPGLVRPIGIRHGSVCWGLVLYDPPSRQSAQQLTHVLLSPIHPTSWPAVFRMQVKLQHRPGSLAALSRVLRDQNVNMLFADCAPTGYNHATWNIVGELLDLKERIHGNGYPEEPLSQSPDNDWGPAQQLAHQRAIDIESTIAICLSRLHRCIEKANDVLDESGFLYRRFWRLGRERQRADFDRIASAYLGAEASITDTEWDALSEEYPAGETKVIEFALMPKLYYFWASLQGRLDVALEFKYSVERNQFVTDKDRLRRGLGRSGEPNAQQFELPTKALATIDYAERYVRVQPFMQAHGAVEQVLTAELVYEKVLPRRGSQCERSPVGLLSSLADSLAPTVNLDLVTNRVVERNDEFERGRIRFVMTGTPDEAELATVLRNATKAKDIVPTVLEVRRHRVERLFLSMKTESGRGSSIRRAVVDVAIEFGFYCSPLTERGEVPVVIAKELKECDILLQVVTNCSADGTYMDPGALDLAWLRAEFFGATLLGRQRYRVVDTSRTSKDVWDQHLPSDGQAPKYLSLAGLNDHDLKERFKDVMRELIKSYYRGHPGR